MSSVICKNLSYSGPSYPSSPVHITDISVTSKQRQANQKKNALLQKWFDFLNDITFFIYTQS